MKLKRFPYLLIALLMFNSCSPKMNAISKNFDYQGHRGSRGLMPENTIPAMIKAIDLGVTTLEMDAVVTKDKQVILSHEPFFNHEITTKPKGTYVTEAEEKSLNIYGMTYAETQTFDVGLKPHPKFKQQQKMRATKPLLSAVIDSVEAYCQSKNLRLPFYNIETKTKPSTDNLFHPSPAEFVELLMDVIRNKKIEDRVIIQSFDPRTLQYLHAKFPGIKTALLIEDFDKRVLDVQLQELGFTPTIYSPAHILVNLALIKACHDKGMQVIPWTVNDAQTMKVLKDMGVDGLITDYPNLIF